MRSIELPVLKETKALEDELAAIEFQETEGYKDVHLENNKKWKKAMLRLLVDKKTALRITKGIEICSEDCCDEDSKGLKFIDNSRFKLHNCPHYSFHIQCTLTFLIF